MPTEAEVAWAAGLFEGEGSIQVVKPQRNRHVARLSLAMTDQDIVLRFEQIIGCGTVAGPYLRGGIYKPIWRWQVANAAGVLKALRLLKPYLGERRSSKAAEAEHALWRSLGEHVDRRSKDTLFGTLIPEAAMLRLRAALGD